MNLLLDHPTLKKLYEVAFKVAEKIESDECNAFETIGLLLLDEEIRYSKRYSPVNSISFACTGGDGVHFGLLNISNGFSKDSPVVMTVPSNSDYQNMILGENVHDFLCLGSITGFFFLEELSYKNEKYLETIFDFDKHLKATYIDQDAIDEYEEYIEEQKILLQILRKHLDLQPWKNPELHFKDLQDKYSRYIKIK